MIYIYFLDFADSLDQLKTSMRSTSDTFFQNICSSTNKEDQKHTMCLNNKGPGCPSEFAEKNFEQGDKEEMLKLSNEKRRSVSLNMMNKFRCVSSYIVFQTPFIFG